jgi:hypothetical protein
MRVFSMSLAIIACVACATLLALADKDGWGWFVFIALLISAFI